MVVLCLFFLVYGALYTLFAFREPPEAIQRFFPLKVPLLLGLVLLFVPEQQTTKVARLVLGALFLVVGAWLFTMVVGQALRSLG